MQDNDFYADITQYIYAKLRKNYAKITQIIYAKYSDITQLRLCSSYALVLRKNYAKLRKSFTQNTQILRNYVYAVVTH